MTLTDQQKRQHYVTALQRFNPTVYTLRALAQTPTGNLRALCVAHHLDPVRLDRGEAPNVADPLITLEGKAYPASQVWEAVQWYASQRPAVTDLNAWMPPSFLKEPLRPLTPLPIRALTAEEETWLPVPFFKPKA